MKTLSATLGKSDKWVARFKATRLASDGGDGWVIAFTSSGASSVSQIQAGGYFYGIGWYLANSGNMYTSAKNSSGSDDGSSSDSISLSMSVGDVRDIQLRHLSQTSYELKVFSDSTYTTQVGNTTTRTVSSQTLDYDQLAIWTKWSTNRKDGLFEDLEVQKGTTEWIE